MRKPNSSTIALLLVAGAAACGGQSCSCLAPIPGGFPIDGRRHAGAMQVRLSNGGVSWLQDNGKTLVSSLLGTMGSKFNVPASCSGSNKVCCMGGTPGTCTLDIGIEKFGLTPDQPSNSLDFDVTATLKSEAPIPVTINQVITADCYFAIDTSQGTAGHKDIDLVGQVAFSVDGTTDLTHIALNKPTVNNLDASMLTITAQSGFLNQLACGAANLGIIKGFIIQQLQSQLSGPLASALDGLCSSCKAQTDCDGWADACTSNKCARKGSCLQEIGATGKLDVGKSFASLSPSTSASMDTLNVLGHYADIAAATGAQPGLSLGLLGGGQADPHNTCVPMRTPPDAPTVDKWMEYTGELEPRDMKPYHLGVGIHVSHINTTAFAAFDAGALCLAIGTASQPLLDAKTIGVIIPSLSDLTHGGDAPLFLQMRPAQEPVITLGAGTFKTDMNGVKVIDDPLMHISVPNFAIDFYAFVDDRYVRVLTLTADIVLGASLDVDSKGELVPLLGDLSKAFTNVRVTNSELLAEDPKHLAAVFPTLLGLAVGQVGGALKPIAVPAIMGLQLQIVAIEPTDGMQFLSLFANLTSPTPDAFHARTTAEVTRVIAPPTQAFTILDPAVTPRVELALGGEGIDGSSASLEWQTALDGDRFWSPWSSARSLTVSDPRLWLQGHHTVNVRARMIGEPATTGEIVPLDFIVDTIAPVGEFDIAGDELRLTVTDNVTPPVLLEYRTHIGATTGEWTHGTVVNIPRGSAESIGVESRDEAGNIGILAFHGRTTNPPTSGCGCDLAGRNDRGGTTLLIVILLVGGLCLARRRRAGALLAFLAIGPTMSACNNDAPVVMLGKGDEEDAIDEIGRYSDAHAFKGVIKISAYDDTMGDLAYAEVAVADAAKPITWQWVDGVPAGPVSTMGGFRNGVSDPGDDVGPYSSLALTSAGDPRIAYADVTNGTLRFARAASSDRKWSTSVVDPGEAGAVTGAYASISLDGGDVPSIAYVVSGVAGATAGGFVSRLRLATAKSATPSGPGDWTIVTLDEAPITCAGTMKVSLCAKGSACVDTTPGDHSMSVCKPVASTCSAACGTNQACVGGACVATLPPVAAPDLLEGIGLFAQLRRLPGGARTVAYYNREEGDLDLATESGGAFAKALIDGNSPSTDVGQFTTMAVAPDGTLHIAYVDAIHDALLYRQVTGTTPGAVETIDDGTRAGAPTDPVGGGAAIWTDGTIVKVVYQDQATSDLWLATRTSGTWSKSALRTGAPGYGFYPHLADDGGKLYLTEFVYDRSAPPPAPLGSLEIHPMQ